MSDQRPNEWQTFFDGHAPKYHDESFTQNTTTEVAFLQQELDLPAGSTILDVGCGIGRHSVGLAKLGYRVTGTDISAGMLAEARRAAAQAGVEVEFVQSDIARFHPGRQYDAAICLCEGALCLLGSADDPYERDEHILQMVCSALKPGGRFITTVLNGCRSIRATSDASVQAGAFDPSTMIEHSLFEAETPAGKQTVAVRERVYTPAEFVGMLKRSGFAVEHVWGGTAGHWAREPMQLDEMEMMVIARKP